jgi:hypothetical protein
MIEVIEVAPTWHQVKAIQIVKSVSTIPKAEKHTIHQF